MYLATAAKFEDALNLLQIKLVAKYDAYLKRLAAVPAKHRPSVRTIHLPWMLLVLLATVASKLLLSPPFDLAALTACGTMFVGAFFAGSRFAKHGWDFDRTPPNAPWVETAAGQTLIQALRRVTLNGLYQVTLNTRLRSDLGLTNRDMMELFKILVQEVSLDASAADGTFAGDPTVGTLLDEMA